jgi:hypothetical protein
MHCHYKISRNYNKIKLLLLQKQQQGRQHQLQYRQDDDDFDVEGDRRYGYEEDELLLARSSTGGVLLAPGEAVSHYF